MNTIARIEAAKARRVEAGLVANNGIACPTQEWVAYYNLRDQVEGRRSAAIEAALIAAKARAVASTK